MTYPTIIDFTTKPIDKPSRGKRTVQKCSKCGLNGEKRIPALGEAVYLHKARQVDGVGLYTIESCWVEEATR